MQKVKLYQPQVERRKRHVPVFRVSLEPKMTDKFLVERWFLVVSLASCIIGFGGFGLMTGAFLGITFSH